MTPYMYAILSLRWFDSEELPITLYFTLSSKVNEFCRQIWSCSGEAIHLNRSSRTLGLDGSRRLNIGGG
ncbi:hypothetical protein Y032_0016g3039 [Ancylostoma ceylanicum]|uniref:Uncharacterized protein n=1 Tax=Ancylostoma ceylanicum TaxID=53326 RepID=A0A016V6R9_9BILA|nr:hypothetical protein Y032_0016g3039 [Ancylostoma ceylanicum]